MCVGGVVCVVCGVCSMRRVWGCGVSVVCGLTCVCVYYVMCVG